jgi:hypothetical protein
MSRRSITEKNAHTQGQTNSRQIPDLSRYQTLSDGLTVTDIAHNSLVSVIDKNSGERVWGIGNIRHMKGSGPFSIPFIQLSTIMQMTNRLLGILVELESLLAEKKLDFQK